MAASRPGSRSWFFAAALLVLPCGWIAFQPLDRGFAITLVALIAAAGVATLAGGVRLLAVRPSSRGRTFGWIATALGLVAIGCALWMLPITFASTWAV